jgi:hypothetical protein
MSLPSHHRPHALRRGEKQRGEEVKRRNYG